MILSFSTKAQTLESLYKKLKRSQVLPVFRFTVEKYRIDPIEIIHKLQLGIESKKVIIRSSAFHEDTSEKSNAGHYLSILNVSLDNVTALQSAIEQVIRSYDKTDSRDEVFIQPMLDDIAICGVAFTADLDTLAPYYIVNYDESGQTDSVTGGGNGNFKTFIQLKEVEVSDKFPRMRELIDSLKEIELLFDNDKLDIEFAFTKKGDLFILQVRPIATENKENFSQLNLKETLFKVHRKVEKLSDFHPNLLGHRSVFGVMPDWNPAEIIGVKPKQLSLSLYKELVTDNIWAFQRDNYGYRNLRSHPLLISFLGVPFIDVRVDFNSFIPKKLNEKTAKKLAEFYIAKLIKTPSYHDKIEFKIVHSCYYFDLHSRLEELKLFGFDSDEICQIEKALLEITNQVIDPISGLYKEDLKKIDKLIEKYDTIVNSDLAVIDKIYWLIEDCKRYGTLPFAGIARAAFIATQLLRSMVDVGILNKEDYHKFLNSHNTVTRDLHEDLQSYHTQKISKETFLKKYGHLRPGTYDILSLRYDENFEAYFSQVPIIHEEVEEFKFTPDQSLLIDNYLKESGLKVNSEDLFLFIKEAIEGREYSKYIFTRSLSKILQLVEELGRKVNIDRGSMAFVDIKTIMNLYALLDHRCLNQILNEDIDKNKNFYNYTKAVKLPSLIVDADDVYGFYLQIDEPNFITLKKVQSRIIREDELTNESPQEKIVFIKSADPGYDFLFTKNIAGLITQYGGANSHMAVRCAELGIPAVIGAGEKNFENWSRANVLEIDTANKHVKIVS